MSSMNGVRLLEEKDGVASVSVAANLVGLQLGRYRLDQLQGHGGMAQVYKAWDPNTQRNVAIKVLHSHLAVDKDFTERFVREGTLIASLNHPNIVGLYDFDTAPIGGGLHYMVMPFIPGPSLKERIEQAKLNFESLSLQTTAEIITAIAAALDYAHGRGMAHRDIKPANILFDELGTPKLADFGLARLNSSRYTQHSVTFGTPAYMSPEQAIGEPGDHRSDIYSLGILLYELLSLTLPYEGETSFAVIMKHVNEPLPSLREFVPGLPAAVEAVVYRATAKQPEDRYQSAGELANELRQAVSGGPVSDLTLTAPLLHRQRPAPVPRPQQRSLMILAAVSALALVVLALAALQAGAGSTGLPGTPAPPVQVVNAMTGGAIPFSTDFATDNEYNAGWPVMQEALLLREINAGRYRMRSQLGGQAHNAIYDPEFRYSSAIIQADMTLAEPSQSDSGLGIVFRYVDENNYYVFAVNGRQQVSIWIRENGLWRELRGGDDNWTVNDVVNPIGEMNRLSVLADADHFTGFVNGERVVEVYDDTIREGAVGFYIATTQRQVENVLTDVAFDRFSVTSAIPAMTAP